MHNRFERWEAVSLNLEFAHEKKTFNLMKPLTQQQRNYWISRYGNLNRRFAMNKKLN